jgi:GntR family transcriptional regulator
LFETEFNVRMVRAEEKIRAEPAVDGLEQLLKVDLGTPLLSVERIAYTYKDVPMELRRGYYRTDTHYYHNTLG